MSPYSCASTFLRPIIRPQGISGYLSLESVGYATCSFTDYLQLSLHGKLHHSVLHVLLKGDAADEVLDAARSVQHVPQVGGIP